MIGAGYRAAFRRREEGLISSRARIMTLLVSTAAPTNNVKSHYRHAGECIRHMNFIRRVSLEHLILGDQTFGAFGEEHLVAQLNGCAHLAALDQVGMGLEDRIDLLGIGDPLAIEHAAARLVDHTLAETAIMRDVVADIVERQPGKRVLAMHLGGLRECGCGAQCCPVKAVKAWLDAAGICKVPLYRPVAKGG